MNNLTLANEDFTYYETLGGGQGACPDADGPSAIHVAMSNTLNTPVEALETEFPLRVRELSLRRGSGGDGAHRGGDGIVRELEALAPMRFTPDHRAPPPPRRAAASGGEDGAAGAQPAERRAAARQDRRRAAPRATVCGSRLRAAAASDVRSHFANFAVF